MAKIFFHYCICETLRLSHMWLSGSRTRSKFNIDFFVCLLPLHIIRVLYRWNKFSVFRYETKQSILSKTPKSTSKLKSYSISILHIIVSSRLIPLKNVSIFFWTKSDWNCDRKILGRIEMELSENHTILKGSKVMKCYVSTT